MSVLPYVTAAWLFLIGLYGITTSRNLIHLVICLAVAQSATYVLLLTIGYRRGAGPPIFYDVPPGTPAVDPVVQALVLTDIVVGATVTASSWRWPFRSTSGRGRSIPRRSARCEADLANLSVLPVAIPLLVAAILMGCQPVLHRRFIDVAGIVCAISVLVLCLVLGWGAASGPIVSWAGAWRPRQGVALGVAFVVDPLGAGLACLAAALATASLVYSWRYFKAVGAIYHALMLVFLAGMVGFCLTGDLFNMFVFFELMSVAAYALTGYKIEEEKSLEGALNFAVVNSVGAFLILMGIALLYGRTGGLNFAQIGESWRAPRRWPGRRVVRPDRFGPRGEGRDRPVPLLARRCPCGGSDARLRALLGRDGRAGNLRDRPRLLDGLRLAVGTASRRRGRDTSWRPGASRPSSGGSCVWRSVTSSDCSPSRRSATWACC